RRPAIPERRLVDGGLSRPGHHGRRGGHEPARRRAAGRARPAAAGLTKGGRLMFHLTQFTDIGLLLLRLMVGVVFFTSGWNTLKDPDARSKNIEMNKPFTVFLGVAEALGALGLIVGGLTQLAGIGLLLTSLAGSGGAAEPLRGCGRCARSAAATGGCGRRSSAERGPAQGFRSSAGAGDTCTRW